VNVTSVDATRANIRKVLGGDGSQNLTRKRLASESVIGAFSSENDNVAALEIIVSRPQAAAS